MESSTCNAVPSRPERQSESASQTVVRAVAAEDGVDETELPPLFGAIDPDALDSLFSSGPLAARTSGTVRFTYAGYEVAVGAGGDVSVTTAPEL